MNIPSHFLPINIARVKAKKREAVSFEKADVSADAATQEQIQKVFVQEKRQGEDRRKRNTKPLLDTRTGRDRRYDIDRPSVDIKA